MADEMNRGINRREAVKLGVAAVAATGLARGQPHRFFTDGEFALVDEITEIIIPTDEKSPGARAAKVVDFIDARLAEAFEDETRTKFRENLKLVDAVSQRLNQTDFMQATPAQREAVLTEMMGGGRHSETPEGRFFEEIKEYTTRGYYTSKIGIHTDLDYKGNVVQGGDYAGILPVGPALGGQ